MSAVAFCRADTVAAINSEALWLSRKTSTTGAPTPPVPAPVVEPAAARRPSPPRGPA
jgi:hypothetical protein